MWNTVPAEAMSGARSAVARSSSRSSKFGSLTERGEVVDLRGAFVVRPERVDADHADPVGDEPFGEMRTDEPGAAGDDGGRGGAGSQVDEAAHGVTTEFTLRRSDRKADVRRIDGPTWCPLVDGDDGVGPTGAVGTHCEASSTTEGRGPSGSLATNLTCVGIRFPKRSSHSPRRDPTRAACRTSSERRLSPRRSIRLSRPGRASMRSSAEREVDVHDHDEIRPEPRRAGIGDVDVRVGPTHVAEGAQLLHDALVEDRDAGMAPSLPQCGPQHQPVPRPHDHVAG